MRPLNRKEIEDAIENKLAEREKHVVNRNALDALFSVFTNPISSLGKIFLGRKDALNAERLRIQQNTILDLLCKIDEAISGKEDKALGKREILNIISGEIEAHGHDVEEVIGAFIASDAGLTELEPGTHIKASGTRAKKVTGLQIGNEPKSKGG